MGVRNGRWDGPFIGKVHYQLSDRVADVRQPSVCPVVFAHWSKGCVVRPGITQRVPQKVPYVRLSQVRPLYYLKSVLSVVPS
jgi:hypothetical protein